MRRCVWSVVVICFVLSSVSSATWRREIWQQPANIGTSLQIAWDIINGPTPPTTVDILEEGQWNEYGQHFVARLSGWVTIPETGDYVFHFSSDDFGALYFSPDEEVANAVLIAQVPGWTDARQWTKYPEQTSAPISLTKGSVHAIYGVMEEAEGGDNLCIGWTGPGISAITIITDGVTHIAPIPTIAKSGIPAVGAVDVPRDSVLSWTGGKYAATHNVYFGTVFDDVNTATQTSLLLVSKGQDATTYDPTGLLDFGQTYYWRIDEVNAPDKPATYKGDIWSFTAETYGYPIDYPAHLVKATASSQSNVLTGPEKTIDGSGINALDQHSISSSQMWLSKKNVSPIWIQYEFDSPYKLHQMWVWNQNQLSEPDDGLGAMEVMIETSTDGTTWTALEGVPEFAPAPGEDTYVHNTTVDFHGIQAKFVKLTINSNFGGLKQAGLSEVRFFYVPLKAYGPTPVTGTTGVAVDGVLNWRPSRTATSHEVYLGTDPNALSKVGTVTGHSYGLIPAGAEYDRTYYWKVDEVNGAEVWAGDVWSFSTPGYAVVDDFESYNDTCKRVFYTWADGYGATTAPECGGVTIAGNGSGSTVGNASAPYAERTLIHGGSQSMPMTYDNASATSFSEATRTFAVPQDWVQGGIKTLVLYFRGAADNSAGQFYVKINNNKVVYNGKADVLTSSLWRQWNVDLTTVGGNLRSVTSLAIGVSGSGRGIVYVDDLRLYRSAPAVVVPVDPGTTSLSAYYMMDGDIKDSSGKGNNGTLVEDPIFVDSQSGFGKALQFDGTNDHVVLPIGSLISSLDSATLASWVNFTTASTGSWVRIFDFGTSVTSGNPLNYMFLSPRQSTAGTMRFAIRQTTSTAESGVNSPMNLSAGWHHMAVVIDGSAMTLGLYLDGEAVASGPTVVLPKDLGATNQNWLGRSQWSGDGYYQGLIDDFRIYNRAMSAGEVRYLAGDRP